MMYKFLKTCFLWSVLFFLPLLANAQQITVVGDVVDENNQPLPGVTVVAKGTTNGIITDFDGNYSIKVEGANTVLSFSFIGYQSKDVEVGMQTTINVQMVPEIENLDEVMVVGYGTQRKKDITTSIAKVGEDALGKETNGNVATTLQGKASGVQVISSAGSPGTSPSVLVRGFTTISCSTSPLYVVDGVPVVNTDGNGGINFLSPDDIESVEVLKDASAAAIYGTRASAGVILVTTKRGKEGKPKFQFSLSYGSQRTKKPYETLKSEEYVEAVNTAYNNCGKDDYITDTDNLNYTDWWSLGTREYTPRMNANFSVSGGSEKHKYNVGMSYFKQESFYNVGDYERLSLRINNDITLANWISVGIDLNPRHENWNSTPDWFGDYLLIDPVTPVYVPDDELTGDENEYSIYERSYYTFTYNPMGREARQDGNGGNNYALTANAHIDIKPFKNFVFRSQAGLTYTNENDKTYDPEFTIDATYEYNSTTTVSREVKNYLNWSWQNTATYNLKKGQNSGSVMVGMTAEEQNYNHFYAEAQGYTNTSEAMRELDGSTGTVTDVNGNQSETSISSYLARLTYNFADKYLLTATMRRDGSSKFMPKNKWANFPSASVAWRFTSEDFVQDNLPFLSDAKLFAGWGVVGNQGIPSSVYTSTLYTDYVVLGGETVSNTNLSTMANEDIKWEKVEEKNIGLDMNFLNSKFTGTIEYYNKTTHDMLFEKYYPYYSGIPSWGYIWSNIGEMQAKGVDVSVGYHMRHTKFDFDVTATLSHSKLKMNEIDGSDEMLGGCDTDDTGYASWISGNTTKMVVGDEPGYFYGYKTYGLFQNESEVSAHTSSDGTVIQDEAIPGDIRFVDTDDSGSIDSDDRVKIGSPYPDFTGGLNLEGTYKTSFGNFDCSVNFYYSIGNDVANMLKYYKYSGEDRTNMASDVLSKAWHGEGTSNDIPILKYEDDNNNYSRFSDFYIEDGSFLRLQTLQVGYSIPKRLCDDFKISKARIYLSGQNLHTWTSFTGINPETDFSTMAYGFAKWNYPLQQTYLVGVNVSF